MLILNGELAVWLEFFKSKEGRGVREEREDFWVVWLRYGGPTTASIKEGGRGRWGRLGLARSRVTWDLKRKWFGRDKYSSMVDKSNHLLS